MVWFDTYTRVKAYGDDICFYRIPYLGTIVGNMAWESPKVIGYISAAQRGPGLSDSEKKKGFGLRTQGPCLGQYPPLEHRPTAQTGFSVEENTAKGPGEILQNGVSSSLPLAPAHSSLEDTRYGGFHTREKVWTLDICVRARGESWDWGSQSTSQHLVRLQNIRKSWWSERHIEKFHWDPVYGPLEFICRYFCKLPDNSQSTDPLGTFSTCHMNGSLLCQPMTGSDCPICLLENVPDQGRQGRGVCDKTDWPTVGPGKRSVLQTETKRSQVGKPPDLKDTCLSQQVNKWTVYAAIVIGGKNRCLQVLTHRLQWGRVSHKQTENKAGSRNVGGKVTLLKQKQTTCVAEAPQTQIKGQEHG